MTTLRRISQALDRLVTEHTDTVAVAALAVSFALSLREAAQTYLNPDEANYYTMAIPEGIRALYESARGTTHPPLYIMLMHWVRMISEHEVALRGIALISGALYPWFLYRWVSLVWSRLAGLLAMLIMAFAPHLVLLAAQARGYTLAFLAICLCLYLQERALRESSSRWMALSAAALYVGIFSEFFVVFFATASGICFLLRAWQQPPRRRLFWTWAVGQAVGVALYTFLFVTYIYPMVTTDYSEPPRWLTGAFPWPGDNLLLFWFAAAVKQYAYLFASIPLGVLMILPFFVGMWLLWKGPTTATRLPSRLIVVMTVVLFALLAAACVPHLHPFGRSRHTVFLGIFISTAIGVVCERLARRRPGIVLPAAVVLLSVWPMTMVEDPNNIPEGRHQRSQMLAGVEYLRAHVPAGSPILMDSETRRLIEYYAGPGGPHRVRRDQLATEWTAGDYRLVSYHYIYGRVDQVTEDLRQFRADYRVPADSGFWLIEGGWELFDYRNTPVEQVFRAGMNFGDALWIVRVPPEVPRAGE